MYTYTRLPYRFRILTFLFWGLIYPWSASCLAAEPKQESVRDLSAWDGTKPLRLDGEWDFYWKRLVNPDELAGIADITLSPGVPWRDAKLPLEHSGDGLGYGTYRLVLRGIRPEMRELSFFVPRGVPFGGRAFEVIIYPEGRPQDAVRGKSGQVSIKSSGEIASSHSVLMALPFEVKNLVVIIHVSNFFGSRGGLGGVPELGFKLTAGRTKMMSGFQELFAIGIMFSLGFYSSMIWWRDRSNTPSCLLTLVAISGACRLISCNQIILDALPDRYYNHLLALEYITMPAGVLSFCLFLNASFPLPWIRGRILNTYIAGSLIVLILPLILNELYYTRALPAFQTQAFVSGILFILFLVNALKKKYEGAKIASLGSVFIIIGICFDIVEGTGLTKFGFYITPTMASVFVVLQAQVVAKRAALAHQKAEDLTHELQEKERARTLFFHNTSHELRTPLNGIMGFLELVYQGSYGFVSDEAKQQISKALRLASSLKVQVNTILDLAKSRRGELNLRVQPINIKELKVDTDNLAEGLCLKKPGLYYKSHLQSSDQLFHGDKEKIFTILRNLLGNAFKFKDSSRDNHVELQLIQNQDHLLIIVEDTGIGIPDQAKDRIFDEFAQVQSDARRAYEGTGLGLTMVRDLVRLMKGTIELTTKEGQGSRFTATIPHIDAALLPLEALQESSGPDIKSPQAEESATHPLSIAHALPQSHDGDGWNVLIIDDNEVNCEVIAGILEVDGYNVRHCLSGKLGLEAMRQLRPHVLLLDMMMPEMSGSDVILEMKKDPVLAEIPVILITARASEEDRIEGLKTGADDYLPKPIFAAELRLRVHNMVERHHLLRLSERSAQDDKLVQLGELFGELSHELKNILHSASASNALTLEDSNLSTAVLPMSDPARLNLAKALIDPVHHPDAIHRMTLLPQVKSDSEARLKRQARAQLAHLNLTNEEILAIWQELTESSTPELTFAVSQMKIFLQYHDLLQATTRCRDVTHSVLSYMRQDTTREQSDLWEAWQQTQLILNAKLRQRAILWDVSVEHASLAISQSSLMQVLLNICLNAADAIQTLDKHEQWITMQSSKQDTKLVIDISNGGPAIKPEIQAKLFQRGFSTKGPQGNGIGLYVCNRIVSQSGGSLMYLKESSSPCFRLILLLSA